MLLEPDGTAPVLHTGTDCVRFTEEVPINVLVGELIATCLQNRIMPVQVWPSTPRKINSLGARLAC